jgi:GTPase SAR1 family protein
MRLCSKHKPGEFTHSPAAGTALHRDVSMKGTVYGLACYGSAGQEQYRTLYGCWRCSQWDMLTPAASTSSHYRGASIIMVCFSLTSMESFRSIPGWVNEARTYNKKAYVTLQAAVC